MVDDTMLDTTFDDVFTPETEVDGLLFALERARAQFAWKVGAMDADGLNQPHPPSTMTLGGLVKHVAGCEDRTTAIDLTGEPLRSPWNAVDYRADPDWEWRTATENSPEELYAMWRDAVERSRSAVAHVLSTGGLDQPAKRDTGGAEPPNMRRILIDMVEHYLRHTGHADLMREAVDGLVGEDPPRR
jgi:hypothetical protein